MNGLSVRGCRGEHSGDDYKQRRCARAILHWRPTQYPRERRTRLIITAAEQRIPAASGIDLQHCLSTVVRTRGNFERAGYGERDTAGRIWFQSQHRRSGYIRPAHYARFAWSWPWQILTRNLRRRWQPASAPCLMRHF